MKNKGHSLAWSSAASTHVGMVRKLNEDSYLHQPNLGLWAVADGMGGHSAGDVASRMVVDSLARISGHDNIDEFSNAVELRMQLVNRRLVEQSQRQGKGQPIGSTLVTLLIYQDQAACLWAGDSRLYLLRNRQLRQVNRDHSQVQEMVDMGVLEPAKMKHHPMAHIITRAIGADKTLDLERLRFNVHPGDTLLLCSDGLSNMVNDAELSQILLQGKAHELVKALIHLALNRGARDNVTVVVVKIR